MDLALLAGLLVGAAFGAVAGYALATGRQGALIARARAAEEKLAYAEGRMAEHFESLSARALDASNERFLELADARLKAAGAEAAGELQRRQQAVEHLVAPLKETLAKVEEQLREVETGRRESHAMLAKQVDFVRQSSDQLRQETRSLVRALQRPEARGRWGELQLRRVVELAGMTRHCDFDEQATAVTRDGTVRPDMVVRLAGGKNIVVDSKVSLAAYLQAAESGDPVRLDAHARHLRDHVDRLAAKSYWQAFSPAPEFVVLFVPGEAFLAPALDRDPALLEYAMRRRVHIATPTTLITMLRTASYAWQQAALSRNARAVFELGRELYERLGTMGRHVDDLGRALTGAIKSYNRTVGSLETRVLVTARRLNDLGVVDGPLDGPRPVEESPRPASAAELTAHDGPAYDGPAYDGPAYDGPAYDDTAHDDTAHDDTSHEDTAPEDTAREHTAGEGASHDDAARIGAPREDSVHVPVKDEEHDLASGRSGPAVPAPGGPGDPPSWARDTAGNGVAGDAGERAESREDGRSRRDPAGETVGFGGRAIPDQSDQRERWQ